MSAQNTDSLKLALKNARHDTTRCNILYELIEAESDDKVWPVYNEQLMELAKKNAFTAPTGSLQKFYLNYYAGALNNMGVLSNDIGDINKALDYYKKSLKIQEEIDDPGGIATALNNIAFVYDEQGNIPAALDFYHRSLSFLEKTNDNRGIANSLNNIGLVYQDQGDYAKALEFFLKGLKIMQEIKDKNGISTSLNNIGLSYDNQGDPGNALKYYHKSLSVAEEINDKDAAAITLINLGGVYFYQGDTTEALTYIRKSLKIYRELNDKRGMAIALNNIAAILFKQGKLSESLTYAIPSMEMATELGYPMNIKDAASTLKSIYKKQNKYNEAFKMYAIEVQMRDSINNEATRKASIRKQLQYHYETQAAELKDEQDKKDLITKQELNQKENQRNYFSIGFGLVIVLALFIFRSYRQKQKANVIISQQKHEVEESRKEILDSIHYAKRIQKAHLPTNNYIQKNINRLQNKG